MDKSLVRDLYFRELEEKRSQDGRLAVHLGVLSLVGGLLVFCYSRVAERDSGAAWPAVVCLAVAVVFLIVAGAQVARATTGHEYARLALPTELREHYRGLCRYYRELNASADNATADFEEFLERRMLEAASRNTIVNLRRSARYYSATKWAAFAAGCGVASGLAAILVAPAGSKADVRIERIEVGQVVVPAPIGALENVMAEPENPPENPTPQPAAQAVPVKPPEPTNILFKGSQEPPVNKIISLERPATETPAPVVRIQDSEK